ncbi:hypothetical protein [Paenibacillus thermotolerans]|uniref:hypothetical protein n=1 Tax=Paenibacillus thermotolerans TaxID=3027807 RepID=UPI00236792A1|nr:MULTISPECIES: hypothetical protein [unclassified Paenibacillus]
MKVCVSIPVHECPDVINDQISNIKAAYGQNVIIVLHRSRQFRFPDRIYANQDYNIFNKDQVFVNPVSLPTQYHNGLVHVHNANFRYIAAQTDFDYFVLHASNDMYVRKGAQIHMASVKNACMQTEIHREASWPWSHAALGDSELQNIMEFLGITTAYSTQPEGIFFEKDVFREMVRIIERFFEYGRGYRLPREEIYYSTLISKLTDSFSRTPLVLSEVTTGYPIDRDTILGVHEQKGLQTEAYCIEHVYAVKRIERNIHHPLRQWIRELMN